MKPFYSLLIAGLVMLTGCKKEEKATDAPATEPAQTITDNPGSQTADAHNSNNSLDWAGSYSGTLPCADCPGIKTVLKINDDNTYSLSSTYLERRVEPFTASGTFAWDETGSIITLDANGDHLKYKVQEGSLKQLDKFGDEIKSPLSEKYILKKE